ncbi:MAG: extracellular solute-binding protein, partial [Clostridia bacterium]|nr:extracellular solute-binding protein [Clostridia bacterium]
MRGRRRIICWTALVLCCAFTLLPFACSASTGTQENDFDTAAVSSIEKGAAQQGDNSLYDYICKNKEIPYGEKEIALNAADAKLSRVSLGEFSGKNDCLIYKKNGTASFAVNIPRDALYNVKLDYCAAISDISNIEISLKIDGISPFFEAEKLVLKRTYENDGEISVGFNGNEIAPKQREVKKWASCVIEDYSTYYNGVVPLHFSGGKHVFEISSSAAVALNSIVLCGNTELESYKSYSKKHTNDKKAGNISVKVQGENADYKSDSTLIPVYDSTSSSTENRNGSANSPSRIHRNTIGQNRWAAPGMWLEYKVDIPQDGLYKLQMRTRQNSNIGMASFRDIYVDNTIPFSEARGFVFPYTSGWAITTFGEDESHPYWIYFSKGQHTIRFTATLDRVSDVLNQLEDVNSELILLYRRIVMVTGISPDANRDYNLDAEIPGLIETLKSCRKKLNKLAGDYLKVSGGEKSQIVVIQSNAKQIGDFIENPDTIPSRLSNFQSNISSLSDWMLSAKSQALEIDYFVLSGKGSSQLKAEKNLLNRAMFATERFLASYAGDYNSIGTSKNTKGSKQITIWFNGSRDQAQIMQDMIEEDFTPKTNISVKLSLVYQGYLESILAGCNPDIALDVARSYPVNLACREALTDLTQFDTYEEVMSRFGNNAGVPYEYNGGVYGLPSTQSFFMLFYRKDIFKELNLSAPQTWDDFYDIVPVLQRNNYEIGLPYSTITVAGTAMGGIGAKDLFATLLFQNGGKFYSNNLKSSSLMDERAFDAFSQWTEFYTTYGFPITYNLMTRFRSGTLPLFIGAYSTYNALMGAAPEIYGLWDMIPIPG